MNETRLDIEAITELFEALREGFSEDDLDELEGAINFDYIEPVTEV